MAQVAAQWALASAGDPELPHPQTQCVFLSAGHHVVMLLRRTFRMIFSSGRAGSLSPLTVTQHISARLSFVQVTVSY